LEWYREFLETPNTFAKIEGVMWWRFLQTEDFFLVASPNYCLGILAQII
jgi:hypothetical protein